MGSWLWVLNFLRPQVVKDGSWQSALFTPTPVSPTVTSSCYAVDQPYWASSREEMTQSKGWGSGGILAYEEENQLILKLDKTWEVIIYFWKGAPQLLLLTIRVDSHKTSHLSWSVNTKSESKAPLSCPDGGLTGAWWWQPHQRASLCENRNNYQDWWKRLLKQEWH